MSAVGERLEHVTLPYSRRRRDVDFDSLFFIRRRRRRRTKPTLTLSFQSSEKINQQNAEGGGEFYSEWEETAESFDQMGLHENLLRGIYAVSR